MRKVCANVAEALADVLADGMTIMSGGFGLCGISEALIAGIEASCARGLTVISNNAGVDGIGLGRLLATRQVRKMISSYVTTVHADDHLRPETNVEGLAKLRPAFDKEGSVTAGNASGLNDGAAALVLMREDDAARRGLVPLARIVSWATAGVDPTIMGTGPIPASQKALRKAGWSIDDLDRIEANEAFAAQACAVKPAWAGILTSSMSAAAPLRSATRSAHRELVSW